MEEIINGKIILIDKPLHWSSFQAVNKLKWAILKKFKLKKVKIGHAGTLDPLATGLLIICTGKFTKKIEEIQATSKVYIGKITLGATTPSFDMETEINAIFPTAHITPQLVEQVRNQFVGEIQQYPPVFSALKKDGKRLYEFAREGKEVDVEARKVSIYDLKLDFISSNELSFEVHCSKGTYIRSLANDIGKALQSGGYLSYLRRTKIGDFSVENALSPEDFVKKHIEIE
jgi:tRNA pseudouridine synthase B